MRTKIIEQSKIGIAPFEEDSTEKLGNVSSL